MNPYYSFILTLVGAIAIIICYTERRRRIYSERKNRYLQDVINQLDEQAKMIIKTDLALNKVQEELDKKITGLYTLHELGKKINSTLNIDDLFALIKPALVSKLGYSNALIVLKDKASGKIGVKTAIGYSDNDIKKIDMLWLDMQGVELEVMKSAPNIMNSVKVVYTEVDFVEAYKGQALWPELRSWLESQGFIFYV